MNQYGLLIDYEYCTNCHPCEVACEEAHDFPPQARGIRVFEDGPWQYGEGDDEKWNWNYIPVPSDRCDLCAERVTKGQEPACVHHCLAQVMKFGRIDDLVEDFKTKPRQVLWMPN
ncbi:4Fe-4S dicluster domain-containing protein [Gordonibacter pamelaeae]|uniref:4Fe-4S dicluster domain-containing protein n=1 Tax=Gordonibacter pamelaeae TaxID=471189 RepID=UPI001D06BDDA|nr:4Fe-4S dicluster domain-containing protein [Gordonibacter pamelaeae]MCB6310659.1 oxidoreductase [Gordonibacter pamelaeae]